jgi:hypothetical protein
MGQSADDLFSPNGAAIPRRGRRAMHDDLTWGIDLSESPWRCARLLPGSGAASLGEEAREIPGRDLLRESGAFLLPAASGDPYLPVLDDWADLREWLRQERDSIRAHLPERTRVGVAYPRSMPPILRQYLPIALGCDPASNRGGLPPDSPLAGLEAPVALTLEAIAQQAIPASGRYAVGCGRGPAREWTAVAIEKAQPTNPAIRGPILRLRVGRTSDSPGSIGLEAGAARLVAGTDFTGPDPSTPVVRMAPSAIAMGAARFARWLALELSRRPSALDRRLQAALLPGTPILSTETIHPLGLIGDDGRGAWFWRRLFEPGTAIPSPRASLRSVTGPPCNFYLAECLSPAYRPKRWLAREEWTLAQLRWHSTHFHADKNSPPPPLRWSLELRDFNDTLRDASALREEVPPRWGLPTWISRLEDDADNPTAPLPSMG